MYNFLLLFFKIKIINIILFIIQFLKHLNILLINLIKFNMYSELLLLFGIIIGVYGWGSSYKKLTFENNYKVRGNYLSFTHSVVSNIVSGLYLYNQNIYLCLLKVQFYF